MQSLEKTLKFALLEEIIRIKGIYKARLCAIPRKKSIIVRFSLSLTEVHSEKCKKWNRDNDHRDYDMSGLWPFGIMTCRDYDLSGLWFSGLCWSGKCDSGFWSDTFKRDFKRLKIELKYGMRLLRSAPDLKLGQLHYAQN